MRVRSRCLLFVAIIGVLSATPLFTSAQNRAYRVSDGTVQTLLDRLESRTNQFRTEIDRSLDSSVRDGTRQEDSINDMVARFENSTDRLQSRFSERRSVASDVDNVIEQAAIINNFVRSNRLSVRSQALWSQIRSDLETLAGYYNVTARWDSRPGGWNNNTGGYTATDAQMRALLSRIQTRESVFRTSFDRWQKNQRRNSTWTDPNIDRSLNDLDRAIDQLSSSFSYDRDTNANEVLRSASMVNRYVTTNRTNYDVTTKWNLLKNDLSTLATYYRTSWNWNNPVDWPADDFGSFDTRITGTYRLNVGQSDNVSEAVERALGNSTSSTVRDRQRRNLERRLQSPDSMAIEKSGQRVMFASGNSQSVLLTADGVGRSETNANGRTVRTSVAATNRDLTITYEGDRQNDYFVSFAPAGRDQLRVTRRVYLENQSRQVTVTSVYDRVSPTARFDNMSDPYTNDQAPAGTFAIPNNTRIVATLDTVLSTRTTQNGDRFSMTVTSPSAYAGAIIEGTVVGEPSGRVAGRASMSLNFERIRLHDGGTYQFAGIVDRVTLTNGSTVSVNNEGQIRDRSQTTTTATRAGIGAVLGAIIGAVAGGGSGAAIGAGVGAGAGAGTVILQGRDNLELGAGSVFSITATAPASTARN